MKSLILATFMVSILGGGIYYKYDSNQANIEKKKCVFNTIFGEVPLDSLTKFETPLNAQTSIEDGLNWLQRAQHTDGGWGAGSHQHQQQMDPHKVPSDPATTAMVAMSLLRTGSDLSKGPFQNQLQHATTFILDAIEKAPTGGKITALEGTQIQRKLGDNIDLVLSTQYLTNLLDHLEEGSPMHERTFKAVSKGVDMVEKQMDQNGKIKNAGWAGVLQSAFASNAIESADSKGIAINKEKLKKSKAYQSSNYDPISKEVDAKDGAGVVLYSVSGSVRANAKDSRKAKSFIQKAKAEGKIESEEVNYDNLLKSGLDEKEALLLETADKVYKSAKQKAMEKETLKGFGNNGGEEFLSFLQTGESLVINNDDKWKEWYDMMTNNLLSIQNKDGSWNGHHCITSPVFCTATCILTLSINNDIDNLLQRGE